MAHFAQVLKIWKIINKRKQKKNRLKNAYYHLEPAGPILQPSSQEIFARFLKLSWIPEPYFNASGYILLIDYNNDTQFEADVLRTFETSGSQIIIDKLPPYTFMRMKLVASTGTYNSPPSNEIAIMTLGKKNLKKN